MLNPHTSTIHKIYPSDRQLDWYMAIIDSINLTAEVTHLDMLENQACIGYSLTERTHVFAKEFQTKLNETEQNHVISAMLCLPAVASICGRMDWDDINVPQLDYLSWYIHGGYNCQYVQPTGGIGYIHGVGDNPKVNVTVDNIYGWGIRLPIPNNPNWNVVAEDIWCPIEIIGKFNYTNLAKIEIHQPNQVIPNWYAKLFHRQTKRK